MCDDNDYSRSMSGVDQDMLTASFFKLKIANPCVESENEKGLHGELDATVWEYLKIISKRIDRGAVPNLFSNP